MPDKSAVNAGARPAESILPALGKRTLIMGILNRTPDSFYDGGRFFSESAAISRAYEMAGAGCDIIDIGGQSTRPGSRPVSSDEEMERVIPVVEGLARNINIPISVDTYYSQVAEEALKKGAAIINDITGLNGGPLMAGVIARHGAWCVIMHMKGMPWNMQDNPVYDDIIGEMRDYLRASINTGLSAGISPQKIIIDPGIGFGKTLEHNLIILNRLKELKALKKPIMVGVSRKSFIGLITGEEPDSRLFGSAAATAMAIANGANIIRTHDPREMREIALVADAVTTEGRL